MDVLLDAAQRGAAYLAALDDRSVAPGPEAIRRLAELDVALQEVGESDDVVLAAIDDIGSPATVATAGGRYFGFVTGGAHPAGVAASVLSSAWDQNVGLAVMSPAAAAFDAIALRWIADLLSLPADTVGVFVSGASMANTTALIAARDHVLAAADWNVREDGLLGAPPLTVFVGREVHSTVLRALRLIGFGRSSIVELPTDAQGRIIPTGLPPLGGHCIVVAQAGNVNSGAFDPFPALIDWAKGANSWVHVDGAFGLWAAASPTYAHLADGANDADSWAVDGHKWLNTPYDSGIALVKDVSALNRSFGIDASYLPVGAPQAKRGAEPATLERPQDLGRNAGMFGPSFSQRARGVEAYAVLRALGRSGVAHLIERTCEGAQRIAAALRSGGHHVLNDVVLNQVVVTFGEQTNRVIEQLQAEGSCWFGGTTWQGQPAMRISVSSWATTEDDIDVAIRVILDVAATTLSAYE